MTTAYKRFNSYKVTLWYQVSMTFDLWKSINSPLNQNVGFCQICQNSLNNFSSQWPWLLTSEVHGPLIKANSVFLCICKCGTDVAAMTLTFCWWLPKCHQLIRESKCTFVQRLEKIPHPDLEISRSQKRPSCESAIACERGIKREDNYFVSLAFFFSSGY